MYMLLQRVLNNSLKSLFSVMALESEGIVICAGDFNMIMDHRVDTTSIKRKILP